MSRLPAVLEVLRSTFATVETMDPADQDVVYRAVLDTVRARRPESCGVLGVLPAPSTPIVDPREADDIPWPDAEELAAENARNVAEAEREKAALERMRLRLEPLVGVPDGVTEHFGSSRIPRGTAGTLTKIEDERIEVDFGIYGTWLTYVYNVVPTAVWQEAQS